MTTTRVDTARGLRWWRSQRHGRTSAMYVMATAVAAAALAVIGWLTYVAVPPVQVAVRQQADGTWVVADVPVAEYAWLGGVRPGMTVVASSTAGSISSPTSLDASGAGDGATAETLRSREWSTLVVTDGRVTVDVPRHPPPPAPAAFWAGAIALALALGAYRVAPTPAWWLLEVPLLAGLVAASDLVPAPIAFGLAVAPPLVAAGFASERPRRLHPIVTAAAWLAVVAVGVAWLTPYVMRAGYWTTARQLSAVVAICLLALGTLGVISQAAGRVRARPGRDAIGPGSRGAFAAAVVDELTPGRAQSRLLATEHERAALAAELHAAVLPDLAAVIRQVDTGMDPAQTAERLRSVSDELRDLMTERHLPILDELGLVPALEWLAERVQERTRVIVDIDVHGDIETRSPRQVELAAYRVAQQAMDNALVHAHPHHVQVTVETSSDRLRLEIADDGMGISPDAERRALQAGRLGLADMRARAAEIGATLSIEPRAQGGMVVELRWPG